MPQHEYLRGGQPTPDPWGPENGRQHAPIATKGAEATYPWKYYERDNQRFLVHGEHLGRLRKLLLDHDDDGVLEFMKEVNPAVAHRANLLRVLTLHERAELLRVYMRESWLWESEEREVNAVLTATPETQLKNLGEWFRKDNGAVYRQLNELVENTETRKDFTIQIERINTFIVMPPEQTNVQLSRATAVSASHTAAALTPKQISTLSLDNRLKLITASLQHTERQANNANTSILPDLISNWSPEATGDARIVSQRLKANNLSLMIALGKKIEDRDQSRWDQALDRLFAGDEELLGLLRKVIANPAVAKDHEDVFQYLPRAVMARLTNGEKIAVILHIASGVLTGSADEATVLKVIETVGEGLPEAQRLLSQQQFVRELRKRDVDNELEGAVDGTNWAKLDRLLSQYDLESRDGRIQKATQAQYNVDEAFAKLGPEDMKLLKLSDRKRGMKAILGRSILERAISNVGYRDEVSLLLLLETTQPGSSDQAAMWEFVTSDDGAIYSQLHSAIDSAEFARLHQWLKQASAQARESSNTPSAEFKQFYEVRNLSSAGLKHSRVIPWSDPGLLKETFGGEELYTLDVAWAESGKIQVQYTLESKARLFLAPAMTGAADLSSFFGNSSAPQEYDPASLVAVMFLMDDEEAGGRQGEVVVMPAISLFQLQNKQHNRQIGEAIDLAVIALGIATLGAATGPLGLALAIADVTLGTAGLVVNNYKDELPAELVEAYETANIALGVLGGIQALAMGIKVAIKSARTAIAHVDDALRLARNGRTGAQALAVAELERELLASRLQLFETIANSTNVDELRRLSDQLVNYPKIPAVERTGIMARLNEQIKIVSQPAALKAAPAPKLVPEAVPKALPKAVEPKLIAAKSEVDVVPKPTVPSLKPKPAPQKVEPEIVPQKVKSEVDNGNVTPLRESGPDVIFREDSHMFTHAGSKPGRFTSHVDADGNLRPANPEGKASVRDHIRGSEPRKSDSPYTSFKSEQGVGKSYGSETTSIDMKNLETDIATGKLKDVNIVSHEKIMQIHDEAIQKARVRYTNSPTAKNQRSLDNAVRDKAHSTRDREILIRGIVPKEYIIGIK